MNHHRFLWLVVIIVPIMLTACGFKLRGEVHLPWQKIAINLPTTSTLRALIKRNLETISGVQITDVNTEAQAILDIADTQSKDVLSLDSAGRVREYRLVRSLTYNMSYPVLSKPINGTATEQTSAPPALIATGESAAAQSYATPSTGTITVTRDISYSDAQTLSKENEEALLWREMQNDLIQQLLHRLAVIKPRPPPTLD